MIIKSMSKTMYLFEFCINKILNLPMQRPKLSSDNADQKNVIGEPDIIPLNFKNAMIDPVNVIAPIAAPKDISIKLAILILPGDPKLKTWI